MKRWKTVAVLSSVMLMTHVASACPVCYGADGTENMSAVNASIIVLLLITGGVLSMFATFILHLRKRMKLAAENNADQN